MSLIYDAQLPVLDDDFQGDEVALLAVTGRNVDSTFRRNYAWAKHAADHGALKKITVVVNTDGTEVLHVVSAVASALSGQRLHDVAVFEIQPVNNDQVVLAEKIAEALKDQAAPVKAKPKQGVSQGLFVDAKADVGVAAKKDADVKPQDVKKEGIN